MLRGGLTFSQERCCLTDYKLLNVLVLVLVVEETMGVLGPCDGFD